MGRVQTLIKKGNTMPNVGYRKKRSRRQRMIIQDLPEFTMYILGILIMSYLGIVVMVAFVMYIIISTLWFMRFVCTYCPHYDKLKCPSGYAIVCAKLFKKRETKKFTIMFKRNIAVVLPAWFLPVIAGIFILLDEINLIMISLLVAFIVNSFIVLPIISKKYGCNECDLKDRCPWMGRFGK